MKIHWTRLARDDRRSIYDHVEADNPEAALALDDLFTEHAARLIDYPMIGRPGRVQGTRELVVHRNYVLVYDLAGTAIRVIRILHAARQWPMGER